jgi:predicted DNA-binding transcriptional regulator AlpA
LLRFEETSDTGGQMTMMQTSAIPKYVNRRQLAELLGCAPCTVDRHVRSGFLPPPLLLGRGPQPRRRWLWSAVEAALSATQGVSA